MSMDSHYLTSYITSRVLSLGRKVVFNTNQNYYIQNSEINTKRIQMIFIFS